MSLADGHMAACVMLTLPSLSLSEDQDMRRLSSQQDLLAEWAVSGEASQWLGRAGNRGSSEANASLHEPLLTAGVWFGSLMRLLCRKKSASILRTWTSVRSKRTPITASRLWLTGGFSQHTCPFLVTHWVTISGKTRRGFFKAPIVVPAWY